MTIIGVTKTTLVSDALVEFSGAKVSGGMKDAGDAVVNTTAKKSLKAAKTRLKKTRTNSSNNNKAKAKVNSTSSTIKGNTKIINATTNVGVGAKVDDIKNK